MSSVIDLTGGAPTRRASDAQPSDGPARRSLSSRMWLRPCRSVGRNVRATGPVLVRGRGEIIIGDDVVIDAEDAPIELNAAKGARLELGRGVRLGPGTSIEAGESVSIGADAVVGAYAKILDNPWHATGGDRHVTPESNPVVVGAGARVGARATLLPGSALGEGSVLREDSVLSRRVPAGVIVSGAPARAAGRVGADGRGEEAGQQGHLATGPFLLEVDAPGRVGTRTLLWLSVLEWVPRMGLPRPVRRLLEKVERASTWAIARYELRSAQGIGRAYAYGPIDVGNQGSLKVGDRTVFRGGPIRTRIDIGPGARIVIGESAIINYGVLLRAEQSIHIGSRCLFGSRVIILDRYEDASGPVTLEDDVWLAHGVTVMPGVRIGTGSVVSAGTVVDRDVPPGRLAVGSPVRFLPLSAVANAR